MSARFSLVGFAKVLCLASLACAALATTSAAAVPGKLHLRKPLLGSLGSPGRPHWACREGACDAIVVPTAAAPAAAAPAGAVPAAGSGERHGLDPQDLQSAYKIPSTLGSPQTVAVVDAYGYPNAEADLAAYRSQYGLPPCTTANGCFKKVNEQGEEGNYPAEEPEWDVEAALDVDMVSAGCPQCHILMVEGSTELPRDLGESVDTAAALGANEISNSYGYPQSLLLYCGLFACLRYNQDYVHPGVFIAAAAGDAGYDDAYFGLHTTDFPAASPNVVAVGGTALFKVPGTARGWFEEVWNEPAIEAGTGSGCTRLEPKPAWQTDSGCSKRTDDVAAVAAVVTPVSIRIDGEWTLVGGTSVSSPLVAAIMAHASASVRALGAQAFYQDPSALYDVTEGFNWNALDESAVSECAPNEYLCNAEVGYDGPTGLGTPDGVPSEP